MNYSVTWHLNQRIILTVISGDVTVDDLKQASIETNRLVRAGIPLVHEVIDMRAMTSYPTRINDLAWLVPYLKETNLGWLIVVTQNPIVRFLSNTLSQVASSRMRSFMTPQEAFDFLAYVDSTLPPLPETVE
jgi:hypothetical protein